ncbi:MAG: hypothetical protein A3J38_04755 [Gammaproteobacteria bacterium RIFCSPHIGHO2_12_FULL_45_9]|nr:MAG: hypothetical protein A3J38_04755 [Gammaproteobacteria bacterium RIFCSPHIGHO2_12_FULL_45_9]
MRNQPISVRHFSIWMAFLLCRLDRMTAEHVLPVFSGYWYTNAAHNYIDACGTDYWIYTDKIYGTAKSVGTLLLTDMLINNPYYSTCCQGGPCTWSEPFHIKYPSEYPPDFPSYGYDFHQDWPTISAQPNAPIVLLLDKRGNAPGNSNHSMYDCRMAVFIYPSYICPPGSRFSVSDTIDPENAYGCTTTPILCEADVVARNLSSTGFEGLGHTAIMRGLDVLEVLDETDSAPAGIYQHTLTSFKAANQYWGAKFTTNANFTFGLSFELSYAVVHAGLTQMAYPFEYTLFPFYHPGSPTEPAHFRCDTFVQYCYETGAGLTLYTPTLAITPSGLFDALPKFRETIPTFTAPSTLITLNETQSLEQLFAAQELDTNTISQRIQALIEDTQLTHAEKIGLLLDLSRHHQHESFKFQCVMDALAILKPAHGIQHLIELFYQLNEIPSRRKLLYALYEGIQGAKAALHLAEMTQAHEVARLFLKETFMTEKQYTLVSRALEYYLMAFGSPMEHLQDIIDITHFLRQDAQFAEIPYYNRILDLFRMIILTPALQQIFLLDVLQDGLEAVGEQRNTFQQVICIMRHRLEQEIVDDTLRNQVLPLVACTDHHTLRHNSLFAQQARSQAESNSSGPLVI